MSFPKITSVMLVVTHACNLRCRYCFVNKEPQTMNFKTAKDTVDFLIANKSDKEIPGINFFGGEPMLCWNTIIVPITHYIRDELKIPFQLSMTTNGTLLTDERLDFMAQNKISMLLSIDGAKATQDYNRPYADGSGSFDIIEPLLPRIAKDFTSTFRMTTIPDTCEHVFENILFADSKGFRSFFVTPNIFEPWSDESWSTLAGEMRKYSDYFIDCYKTGKTPIYFSTFEDSLRNINKINAAINNKLCRAECDARYKCGLGTNKFASIHPSGDIYACQEMTSNEGSESIFWIGNIYTGVDEKRREELANAFNKELVENEECGSCRLYRICRGSCVANNYLINGDINKPSPIICKWEQMLLDEAIYVMNSLANTPAFIQRWKTTYSR